jgi:uncharacterized membrane protein
MPQDTQTLPLPARFAVALERDDRLDRATALAQRVTAPLGRGATASVLSGRWMGHALHPSLTDLPIGLFTAAGVLDALGGVESRPAARRLIGLGLLAAAPTAASGWTEWHGAEQRDRRVGVVHAVLNVGSLAAYTGSWMARRRGRHATGVVLALAGSGLTGVAAYLGGHLASARGVATRHPALSERNETMSEAEQPKPASSPLTARDVVEAVTAQHGEITRLLRAVRTADDGTRADALHRLCAYLAGHEAVEEVLLHPRAEATPDPALGTQRVVEEEGVGQQIGRLEDAGVTSPVFVTQLGLLEEAITQHAAAEEKQELPGILDSVDASDAALIVRALREQEAAADRRTGSFAEMLEMARHDVRGLAARR